MSKVTSLQRAKPRLAPGADPSALNIPPILPSRLGGHPWLSYPVCFLVASTPGSKFILPEATHLLPEPSLVFPRPLKTLECLVPGRPLSPGPSSLARLGLSPRPGVSWSSHSPSHRVWGGQRGGWRPRDPASGCPSRRVTGHVCLLSVYIQELQCDVSVEEDSRQEWTFTLYDFDNNGKVTREVSEPSGPPARPHPLAQDPSSGAHPCCPFPFSSGQVGRAGVRPLGASWKPVRRRRQRGRVARLLWGGHHSGWGGARVRRRAPDLPRGATCPQQSLSGLLLSLVLELQDLSRLLPTSANLRRSWGGLGTQRTPVLLSTN